MNKPSFDTDRYSRQTILDGFGTEKQEKLHRASALIIGCGGLGIPAAVYLASSGVGKLGLMDADVVSKSNLHRQVVFKDADIGRKKADVLQEFVESQNPDCETIIHNSFAKDRSILQVIKDYDLVLDCTDNFESRYLINDACTMAGKPVVYGAVNGFEGQAALFNVQLNGSRTGVYRDIFPKAPEPGTVQNCEEAGVMGHVPGIVGTVMAGEGLKYLSGMDNLLVNTLWIIDGRSMRVNLLKFQAKDRKPAELKSAFQSSCRSFDVPTISWSELRDWDMSGKQYELVDVREINEHQLANAGGRNLPLSTINLHLSEFENLNRPLVLYCQSGQRSGRAVHDLMEDLEGIEAYSVSGGMKSRKS